MKMGVGGESGPEAESVQAREDRFWERYEAVVLAEVAESVPSAGVGREPVFARWGEWAGSLERMVQALRYLHYGRPCPGV
ncbi:MAG TPA: hypothetical protein PKM43_05335 [Verrucomicrobiota bacterium]|nr:hypothetical protein [Verrucomicrobiota bacterium]HRZ37347.1 hypothetical protein [Candidatus Paceibacterota bacterium]HRZ56615.1 hypothetical protein [Candidatus Paceibacterota bacterium]